MEHRRRLYVLCTTHGSKVKHGKGEYIGLEGDARTHGAVAVVADVEYAYGALVVHALSVMHTICSSSSEKEMLLLPGTPTRRSSCPSAWTRDASHCPPLRKRGSAMVLHARRRQVGENQSCGGSESEVRIDRAQSILIVQTIPLWQLDVPRCSPLRETNIDDVVF